MCGIFGYIGNKKEGPAIVLSGLKSLEYRGYDSWGIAVWQKSSSDTGIKVKKNIGKIGDVSVSDLPIGSTSLGHTRWATHGGVTVVNAHPHLDESKRLALIHNGIIENYDIIRKELIQKKHIFKSETDTEVAVHLIEDIYAKLQAQFPNEERKLLFVKAVRAAFIRFEGMNAMIVLDAETNSFVAAKNGSPLVIGKGKGENYLASDAQALLPYTNEVYYLEDEEIALVYDAEVKVFDIKAFKQKKVKWSRISLTQSMTEKGHFPHFMLKEITDQTDVISNIAYHPDNKLETLVDLIKKSYGSYLIGCGSAAYACLAGTYIFSKIAKRHINFSVASEFSYLTDFLTNKSLIIALSQSGETIDVIDAVKMSIHKKAKISSLVNVVGSSLYRLSDNPIYLSAGVEKAVVSTKAFTAKLAYLILMAYMLKGNKNEGVSVLKKTCVVLKSVLDKENQNKIKRLADKLKNKEHVYIIGRGVFYPIALEAALKIKEASYIHAEGFAAGELKHGVIALVEKDTPCIVFLPNDETYNATLAGAMEVKARGGKIIGISDKNHDIFDEYLPCGDSGIGTIIPAVTIAQLLGYYLSVLRGSDPDKPRNLAKSVTVR